MYWTVCIALYTFICLRIVSPKTNAMYMLVIIGIVTAAYFAAKGINSANDISKY